MSDDLEEKLKRAMAGEGVRNLPKRFYKDVQVAGQVPALSIQLDGRPIKTPMKAALAVPTVLLAKSVAAEWDSQIENINPTTMPLTRLCNTAIDRIGDGPQHIIQELVDFAGSDLICYRADTPEALVRRQEAAWDPLMAFSEQVLGAQFTSVCGIMHQAQSEAALTALNSYLQKQDAFALTAIHNMTTLTGSCIIGVAVHHGHLDGDAAWSSAHVDEDWQIEYWGEDDEGVSRRIAARREFDAAVQLLELIGSE